jgi:hypothetical protein
MALSSSVGLPVSPPCHTGGQRRGGCGLSPGSGRPSAPARNWMTPHGGPRQAANPRTAESRRVFQHGLLVGVRPPLPDSPPQLDAGSPVPGASGPGHQLIDRVVSHE